MTKIIYCNDLVPGCDFKAEAETEDDLLQKAAEHAREAHGIEVTPELAENVRAAIRDD